MSLLGLLSMLPKGMSIIEAEQFFVQAIADTFAVNLSAGELVCLVGFLSEMWAVVN